VAVLGNCSGEELRELVAETGLETGLYAARGRNVVHGWENCPRIIPAVQSDVTPGELPPESIIITPTF